uniref:Uncharacterized protein n=1 Tax=Oryza glumipatula TaxID=40148 RepID=A0A0D9Z9F1_9ORYZ
MKETALPHHPQTTSRTGKKFRRKTNCFLFFAKKLPPLLLRTRPPQRTSRAWSVGAAAARAPA